MGNNIDKNFENLKAQMILKKDIAKKNEVVKPAIVKEEVIEEINTSEENVSQSKIVIKRVEKANTPKRITYYLNGDTIKKIDRYSKMAGMGKSAFVQTLLDLALNNLEIE